MGRDGSVSGRVLLQVDERLTVAEDPVVKGAVVVASTTSRPCTIHPQPLDPGVIWIDSRGVDLEKGILNRQRLAKAASGWMIFAHMVITENIDHHATSSD